MLEPAALNPSALEAVLLPPVTDARRDDEFIELEQRVEEAERAVAESRYDDAVALLGDVQLAPAQSPDLALRVLLAGSWARMYRGELDGALELLKTAKQVAHRPGFNDVDRAEVLYRIGCVRVKRGAVARAVNDLTLALELCERSGRPCDRLRAEILEWRSRCYQRQRDFDSARNDVEHALELADGVGDRHAAAHVNFRASVIAERNGNWILARFYAEQARDLYEDCNDRVNVGRLLNNLGGLDFLLGDHDAAVTRLKQAVAIAVEVGGDVDAAYAISSLAQVHLRTGSPELAEPQARHAARLLEGREDALDELGNVQLVLGRSLLEQGRPDEAAEWFAAAESSFASIESVSLLAAAWIAQGDVAGSRGDSAAAAVLYRRAAEALQDFNF
jgi:tetratricopeptide (TPR) repeat protein